MTFALGRTLAEAAQSLGELAGLGRNIPNPQILIQSFVRREAVLSSRIEGTRATVADLYAYEAGQQLSLPGIETTPPDADIQEVLNYVHALEYGLERLQTLPVSVRFIRELHERLMHGVRGEHATPGEVRRSQNWIGTPGATLADATYVPPPVDQMHLALDAFERYLHEEDEYPQLIRLAFIHYQFEAIHPFLDGNGRIGRLLLSLLLVHWGLLSEPLLYLSAYFERNRQLYYDHLLAVSRDGAWREWTMFFLTGVVEQSQNALSKAKELQDLRDSWRNQLQDENVPSRLLNVIDGLFQNPIVSANDLREKFGVSHPTAMTMIRRLVKMGVLVEMTGRERNQRYVAQKILFL